MQICEISALLVMAESYVVIFLNIAYCADYFVIATRRQDLTDGVGVCDVFRSGLVLGPMWQRDHYQIMCIRWY